MQHFGIENTGDITCTGSGTFASVKIVSGVLPTWLPEDEGRFMFDSVTKNMYYGTNVMWQSIGGGTLKNITQALHGFTIGNVLRYNSGTSMYVKSQANSESNSRVVGIVSGIISANMFTLLINGYVTSLSGLTPGSVHFLSDSVAGALTTTEPVTEGYISKPLIIADTTTSGYFVNMRGLGTLISNTVYGAGWDGVTTIAPSKNAVYDKIETLVSDAVYGAGWDGVFTIAPSKNAVYDKIESLGAGMVSDLVYGAGWDGITTIAPSKNAVYDKIQTLVSNGTDPINITTSASDGTNNNSIVNIKNFTGDSLSITWHSSQLAPEQTPHIHGRFTSGKIYNAIFNDMADFLELDEELETIEYGKVYTRNREGVVKISSEYLEKGIIGIVTNTYGYGCGFKGIGNREIPISIGGFVLAYVDKEYDTGTPLTCTKDGYLTEIDAQSKLLYPERIIATFYKPEKNGAWFEIAVNGRMWVKVK